MNDQLSYHARITVPVSDRMAGHVAASLAPECTSTDPLAPEPSPASETDVGVRTGPDRLTIEVSTLPGTGLSLTVAATDLTALQAGINSFLRWIQLSIAVASVVTDPNDPND